MAARCEQSVATSLCLLYCKTWRPSGFNWEKKKTSPGEPQPGGISEPHWAVGAGVGWGGGGGGVRVETQAWHRASHGKPSSRRDVSSSQEGKTHPITEMLQICWIHVGRRRSEGHHGGHGISCRGNFLSRGMSPIWGSVVNFETDDLNVFIGASMWFLRLFSKFFPISTIAENCTPVVLDSAQFDPLANKPVNYFQLCRGCIVLAFQELTMTTERGINCTLQFSCSAHYLDLIKNMATHCCFPGFNVQ